MSPLSDTKLDRRSLLSVSALAVTATLLPRRPGHKRDRLLGVGFDVTARFHPVEIVSPGFVLVSQAYDAPVGAVTHHPATIPAPYVGVEIDLGAGGEGTVVAGVGSADGAIGVLATYTPGTGAVTLEEGGRTLATAHTTRAVGTLGFALNESQVTVLARDAHGWTALATHRVATDLRRPSTLATLGFMSGARGGRVALTAMRAGLFGMAGLRDPHVVQEADGTPYTRDGFVYLTWTCAGLGFFRQAHWGVFRMRLDDPASMEQVAHLFTRRGGHVLGDHAGQLVRDGDRWLVANSSWGDFDGSGVQVRWTTTTADLLSGVHVLHTRAARLPTRVSSWDPGFTRIDRRWHVTFIESPSQSPFDFHPALATTRSRMPFDGLRRVGADTGRHQTEGAILARDADGWKVLASDGDARRYPVYDLAMRRLGRLHAPYGSNIPHPQVIPRPDGSWMMMTFDATSLFSGVVGYGAHGSVIVMEQRS